MWSEITRLGIECVVSGLTDEVEGDSNPLKTLLGGAKRPAKQAQEAVKQAAPKAKKEVGKAAARGKAAASR